MFQLIRFAAGGLAVAGVLAATLPVAEAQPTPAAPRDGGSCFYLNQIQNSRMVNPRLVYIRTSARTFYRMDFAADCNTMGTEPLVFHPVDNSGQVCGAISLDVSVRGTHQRCLPTGIVRMTPDEVAAVSKKDLP